MRRVSSLLTAITVLLICLLSSPVLAEADRSVSPRKLSDLHLSVVEGGESETTEEATSEEEQLATSAEAEEENETGETEEPEPSASTPHHRGGPRCVVPALQGESLSGARVALSRAHCKLGKVSEPRAHHGGLVIVTQSQAAGRRLSGGALIAVRLSSTGGKTHHRR
jgi:hypothetical protein